MTYADLRQAFAAKQAAVQQEHAAIAARVRELLEVAEAAGLPVPKLPLTNFLEFCLDGKRVDVVCESQCYTIHHSHVKPIERAAAAQQAVEVIARKLGHNLAPQTEEK